MTTPTDHDVPNGQPLLEAPAHDGAAANENNEQRAKRRAQTAALAERIAAQHRKAALDAVVEDYQGGW